MTRNEMHCTPTCEIMKVVWFSKLATVVGSAVGIPVLGDEVGEKTDGWVFVELELSNILGASMLEERIVTLSAELSSPDSTTIHHNE
jgi:hypothetical protein